MYKYYFRNCGEIVVGIIFADVEIEAKETLKQSYSNIDINDIEIEQLKKEKIIELYYGY
ncbi:hypothetical protein K413DRAFT_4703 [Clostridium sp. ASBs410]|nr:hypothetical protein K413DRAFT_4703 [Clostridium sp. ASBs410]